MRLKNIYPKPEKPTNNDDRYLAWIRTKVSCVSGRYSEYVLGEGRNLACHVRRAHNSGIGYKPIFSAVPMTFEEHNLQHSHGEKACLLTYHKEYHKILSVMSAEDWFRQQADRYRETWDQLHLSV